MTKRLMVDALNSVGVVVAGANPESDILITKRADPEEVFLRATAPHSTPTSDKPWDGPAATRRLPNEAAALRRVHAWVDDSGDPDAKSSYKFPHHDRGGAANLAAARNGLARLSGASIPAADKVGVRRHLAKHLRDGGGEPAETSKGLFARFKDWLLAGEDDALDEVEKARNLAEYSEAKIHSEFTVFADDLFGSGFLSQEERIAMSSAIGEALRSFRSSLEESQPQLFDRDPFDGPLAEAPVSRSTGTGGGVTIQIRNPVAPTAQAQAPRTIDDERREKEAEMPDITLSDEAREDLDKDALAYVEHLEAEVAKAADAADAGAETPADDPLEKALEGVDERVAELLKARDVEQSDRIAKAEAAAEQAEQVAKDERDRRLSKEYLEKAAEAPNFAPAPELAVVLRKADEGVALEPEEAEKLAGWIKAANSVIATSQFFNEFGAGGSSDSGSAMAIIAKKAAELRKDDPKLSQAQAEAQVMDSDRDLALRADAEERDRSAKVRS